MAYSVLSDIQLSRDPVASNHAATKNYVDVRDSLMQTYNTTAPSSPELGWLWTDTSAAPRYVLKQYNGATWITLADTQDGDSTFVNVTGDTMTGELILSGNPSNALGAAPKQYVDLRALASVTLTAGAGLTGGGDLSSNKTFNVVALSTGGLQVNADDIQLKLDGTTLQTNASGTSVLSAPRWTTTRNITLTGTINGTSTIDGTGDITISTSGGGAPKYVQQLTGGATTEVVTHNLGTKDVSVTVYEIASGTEVGVENARTSINAVTLTFAAAPAAATYRVVIT